MISPAHIPGSDLDHDNVVPFREFARLSPVPPRAQLDPGDAQALDVAPRGRRRRKFQRFAFAETAAVVLLAATAAAGVSDRYADNSFTLVFQALTIASAIAVAVIPVIFYGRPDRERGTRRSRRR